ncbi:insulinase family protein [Novosphingobium sp.]|uniref:insulinase family protein n=1 Tax=Novosphingobium sp. TaxID=1874826 RepID=UPI003B52DC12
MGLLLMGLALAAGSEAQPVPILPATWVTAADYPAQALKALQTGAVFYTLTVNPLGATVLCSVTRSSGAALLDLATCDLLKVRAKFVAPRDAGGQALASTYSGSVKWVLPVVAPAISLAIGTLAQGGRYPPAPARAVAGLGFARPSYVSAVPAQRYRIPPAVVVAPASTPPVDVAQDAKPPVDPAVRYGQLGNGLRYAIMRNGLTFDATSIRLSVAAGSLEETDAQRGYAHLVEHMMFRGSADVPDGQFAKSLERVGLTLGTDTTAFTTPEAVLFGLDFPAATPTPVATGLFLLRQAIDKATIAQSALDSERGVVLSERRLRDDPGQRWEVAREAFLLAGQRAPTRVTIGTIDAVTHADAAGLRAYYDAHFRPEKTFLVVAGNVNVDQVEHEIAVAFGGWADKGPAVAAAGQGQVVVRGPATHLYVAQDAPFTVEADWVSDYDTSPDTMARERRNLASNYAGAILSARLARLGEEGSAPFVSASAQRGALYHSAMVTSLSAVPKLGQMDAAVVAMLVEERRLVQYGITAAELERVEQHSRSAMVKWTQSAATRGSAELANAIQHAADTGVVFVSPAQGAANMTKILATLTLADVDAAAKRIFSGSGPLIFASAGTAPVGGEAGLAAAVARAQAQSVTPPAAVAKIVWPYANFGAPGQIVARRDIADLGVTIVHFANGTSVTVKSTSQPKDQILVNLNFGLGLSGLPDGLERSYWQISGGSQTFVAGGLGKVDYADLREEFPGRRIGLSLGASESRFVLGGETSGADLDLQLQLLTAYASDPAYRPAAFERARALARTTLGQDHATASLAMQSDLFAMLSSGDRRWSAVPRPADIDAAKPEDLARILGPALAGPLNMVIVGDVPVERAIAAAAATIGALPRRTARVTSHAQTYPLAPASPTVVTDTGAADDAVVVAAWPTPGFFRHTPDSRAAQVLAEVMRGRLTDGLREKVGATYSPSVLIDQSEQSPGYGYIAANVELKPGQSGLFFATIGAIADDLMKTPVSVEELGRAREPLLDTSRQKMHVISYWAYGLIGADEDPRLMDVMRTRLSDLAAVKPEDIQRLARAYFAGVTPYRIIFKAAGQ